MSTKIYNAYAIKNLSHLELKSFTEDLRDLTYNKILEAYKAEFVSEFLDITYSLKIADYFNKEEQVIKILKYIYEMDSKNLNRDFNIFIKKQMGLTVPEKEKKDIKDILEEMNKYKISYNPKVIVKNILEYKIDKVNKMDLSSISLDDPNLCIDEKIVLYPLTSKKSLFVSFGYFLPQILSYVAFSKDTDCVNFREKYGLVDYHYQNQTDRPDYVTAAEWRKRKKDWDKVIPCGTFER